MRNKRIQEKIVSNQVINKLRNKGYLVHRHYSVTTKSIYLKIDYGVCCGIRISDHNGKRKYRYRFNLINQYKGPKEVIDKGYVRYFYDYKKINELIADVDKEKQNKIKDFGLYKYKTYMKQNAEKDIYKSFTRVA